MNMELAKIALTLISQNTSLLDEADFPNIVFPTMGGYVWWRDLVNVNGWRIQQNSITKHCRILDPADYRRAWGGEKAMTELFEKLVK